MSAKIFVVALFAASWGCAGKSTEAAGAGAGRAVDSAAGGQSSGGSPGSSASGGVGASVGGTSSPVVDAGTVTEDATTDASPPPDTGCVGELTCSLTPADVACSSDADCTTFVLPSCGSSSVIGVNRQALAHSTCSHPPCVPPQSDAGAAPYFLQAQDCKEVSDVMFVSVRCVAQRCLTWYPCSLCPR
jgi:hypothetical protein